MLRPGILAVALTLLATTSAAGESQKSDGASRTLEEFSSAMAAIAASSDGVVVTSRQRTDADQARLAALGYKPHPCSQHKLGLAWDLDAPDETLASLAQLAAERGFTALVMQSPVTGSPYLHVQRYARSPLQTVPPSDDEPTEVAADAPATEVAGSGDFVLTESPRPLAGSRLDLPRHLLRKKADGRIVLLLHISEEGRVLDLAVAASDLPDFEDFVKSEVSRWSFAPPLVDGRPVTAVARLPIPIRIR